MADSQTLRQASILAALAQPTRLQILDRVADAGSEGVTAGNLARAIRCPPSTLSFHLKELTRTGVLEPRPEGRFIRYSLRRPALKALAFYIAGLAGARSGARSRKGAGSSGRRRARPVDAGQLTIFGD